MISEPSEIPQQNPESNSSLKSIQDLRNELQNLRTANLQNVPDQQALYYFSKIDEKPMVPLLLTIIYRLKQEKECPSEALVEAVDISNGKIPDNIKFDKRDNLGEYKRFSRKIHLSKEYKNTKPSDIIRGLALEGSDELTTTIHHEGIHVKQRRPTTLDEILDSARHIKHFYSGKTAQIHDIMLHLLTEIQAYTAAQHLDEKTMVWHISHNSLYRTWTFRIKGGGGAYPEHIEAIKKGYQDIKRLYALGFSDDEVAQIVQSSTWNEDRNEYESIGNRVTQALKKGMSLTEIDKLVEINDLNWSLYIERAKIIAREELMKVTSNLAKQATI